MRSPFDYPDIVKIEPEGLVWRKATLAELDMCWLRRKVDIELGAEKSTVKYEFGFERINDDAQDAGGTVLSFVVDLGLEANKIVMSEAFHYFAIQRTESGFGFNPMRMSSWAVWEIAEPVAQVKLVELKKES